MLSLSTPNQIPQTQIGNRKITWNHTKCVDFNIQSWSVSWSCTLSCTNIDMQPGMTCHKYKQSLNCISRVNSNCIRYGIQQLKHLKFMILTPFSAPLHCSFPVASPAFQQLQQRMWHWNGFKPGFFTETGGKCGNLKRFHRKGHGKLLQLFLWLAHVSPRCRFQKKNAEDFWFLPTKSHCHHTPIWLRSPRGGDENLTSNEN